MAAAAPEQYPQPEITGFTLALQNFEGPFDLLLTLIQSKKLDVTEVALAEVTDEFIAYTRALGETEALDEVTEFLVVAATLLDLKTAGRRPRRRAGRARRRRPRGRPRRPGAPPGPATAWAA